MRKLIFIAAVAVSQCAFGANVLWDALELDRYGSAGGDVEYVLGWTGFMSVEAGLPDCYCADVWIRIQDMYNSSCYWVESVDYDFTATGVTANWLCAENGDIADAGTTRNVKYYFNHCHLDHETGWENQGFFTDPDADFYLMFAVGSLNDHNAGIPNPNCLYGWAQLKVDGNGELGLIRSAIGLDGQAMIVGAIPEPSSALLLLLGCAGLALRRRRRFKSSM